MSEATRVRLDLAYDGTHFAGWARQAGEQRTVQGVLEAALATATARAGGEPPRLVVAGRTDAGVHATGQVAHVDLAPAQLAALARRDRPPQDVSGLALRLTGMLAARGDVVVHRATPAPDGFDARFSAVFRRYRYRIADAAVARNPLDRHRTLAVARAVDDARIRAAAEGLLGLHDFAAYCRPRPGATTIRTLQALTWSREPDGVLVADVRADAFCHGMVRALVGASIAVGLGRLPPERLAQLLDADRRSSEYATAPAHGLTLVEVGYPDDDELAAQAERARARRLAPGAPAIRYP
ncbi:tRNA pseudouridine synthase A [Amnibacterium sp. CER49]|uniref:tRNA pseudouridine synthase A n=1 Tax=Amnibacterium sp. CER49 TaxID=3039161 RepID=UPI00244C0C33|nr:tRNA pseudouridine synthase A [Amnibacterium sp. CER49]MDH2443933.1 tRNA pseudouridine synthase A [Amnibacterium sp. CER49]